MMHVFTEGGHHALRAGRGHGRDGDRQRWITVTQGETSGIAASVSPTETECSKIPSGATLLRQKP